MVGTASVSFTRLGSCVLSWLLIAAPFSRKLSCIEGKHSTIELMVHSMIHKQRLAENRVQNIRFLLGINFVVQLILLDSPQNQPEGKVYLFA